jgi:Spy/CpxP family protein refolding chaperone
MSTQTKSKLYLLIIGILLITNIGMLFFFLGNKDGGKKTGNRGGQDRGAIMKSFLKDSIGFNDVQLQQYDTLSKQHRENSKAQFDSLKNSKEEQFKELGNKGFSDSAIFDMIKKSSEKQKAMEFQLLNHFAAIRKICTAAQQPKFDSLFYKIWSKKKKPEEKK